LDKKVNIDTHSDLFNTPNVYFIKERVDIHWAGYSTAKAAFNSIKQIASSNIKYDFINLMTGQDYPIKPAKYIAEFLQANIGKEFIEYKAFKMDWEEAFARIDRYHFTDFKVRGRHWLEILINSLTKRRKMPLGMVPYGVSTFWMLSPECALYVVNFVEKNKKLGRFLKYTWGSDEFIFQTILMNSHYKENIVNDNYRYVDWSAGGARPKFLHTEDYNNIKASDKLFGRKFNIEIDENILDMIDAYCLEMDNLIEQPIGLYN
jgi:hypothetical protein